MKTSPIRNPARLITHRYFFYIFASLILFGVFTGNLPAAEPEAKIDLPFLPGEKLTFRLKWGFIPAGEAVLEVLPVKILNGIRSYHFVLTAKTTAFVDIFYKVRNRIESYTDRGMTHSIHFRQKKHEGKTRRDIIVEFDWDKNQAHYSNFGKKREPVSILPGSFDPLSVFYYARLLELKENAEIKCPVTDGKKSIVGIAKVIKREKVTISDKTYDTFLMEPELEHVGGVFEKSKDARIRVWVTADRRKIPVKIKSKVAVGSFVGELVAAEGLK
jgi:hypothetical protein